MSILTHRILVCVPSLSRYAPVLVLVCLALTRLRRRELTISSVSPIFNPNHLSPISKNRRLHCPRLILDLSSYWFLKRIDYGAYSPI